MYIETKSFNLYVSHNIYIYIYVCVCVCEVSYFDKFMYIYLGVLNQLISM